jgi:predicted RNA-binding protein with PUA-like domain
MPDHKIAYCRSCKFPIVWMKTEAGRNMPVDPDDVDPDDETFDPKKHTSHFATCEHAGQHRRR